MGMHLRALCWLGLLAATAPAQQRTPIVRVVDLNAGESAEVELAGGSKARVKLLSVTERRDTLRAGLREARATVEVNGRRATLVAANYRLPVEVGGVQIDCSATKGLIQDGRRDSWGLTKDARVRLWPKGSPWIEPGTFVYPLKQRWFATMTQMANEMTYVDGGERAGHKDFYYHNDLDFGGAEGMVEVVAATGGLVVTSGLEQLPGHEGSPAGKRYDVVYVLDDRGWYYRYSHLYSIDPAIRPGANVKMGQKIGILGKEGASGGWSHLHFGIVSRQPSGQWGTQEAYACVWEAYQRQYPTPLVAVARPHHFLNVGETAELDGSLSWSASGQAVRHEWIFSDGIRAKGPIQKKKYVKSGCYSEILKVTDSSDRVSYDFAVVQVADKAKPDEPPPSIHPAFHPTLGIRPGQPVTFKVRTFRTTDGEETWDFGDGSPSVKVRSDGCVKPLAKDGYAVTEHRFAKPGDYIVKVERLNARGQKAMAHLWVRVE